MARTTIQIDVPIQQVFDELLRPDNFGEWVVGAKRIRGTRGDWPSEGAEFHHTVGFGPARIADVTRIEEMRRPERLVLDARAWPAGDARVELTLTPAPDDATVVVMVEEIVAGLARLLPSAVNERMIGLRNRRSLKRLRRVVECHRD